MLSSRCMRAAVTLAVLLALHSTTTPQVRSRAELIRAATAAFAGIDMSQKKGPLVKVGFDLALLREEYRDHAALGSTASFRSSNSLLRISEDRVVVDVIAEGSPASLETGLKSLGMQITGRAGSMISGSLPITSIESVAALGSVRFVQPATWMTSVGLTTSQGDTSMGSEIVRTTLGFNGAGVTVGVISDSYNYLGGAATDVASGDLPGVGNPNGFTSPVNVLADNGTTDEGRAMLQIVHDVAPGAALAFATANGGQATFANNITNLWTSAGANVIVDDVIYYAEPMFQDGIIAQAADAAKAAGVAYFSAAANQASKSYESVWRSGPVLTYGSIGGSYTFWGGTSFDFDPGSGVDYMQSFTLANNSTILLVQQWDSPFASVCTGCPGSANDLDIYVLNAAGTQVLASAANDNVNGNAVELVQFTNSTGTTATFNILIAKYSGPDPGFLKYVNFGSTQGGLEFATNSSTIYGHANASGAEAVGAAAYYNTPAYDVSPPILESFSSTGPTAIRFTTAGVPTFDPRADKPEITAPDGGNTTFFVSDILLDDDTYPNFFGTSAAAPHAAGVAALMLQVKSSATPAQVYSALEASAIDMGPAGYDNSSGFGLIQAVGAINIVVPIELGAFTGILEALNTVRLDWTTLSETNNYGFEVQRKSVGASEFVTLANGFVAGHGTTLVPQQYSFTDRVVAAGSQFYRLKQIDLDGTIHFTDAIEVGVMTGVNDVAPGIIALRQNYPNPFNPETGIEFSVSSIAHTRLVVYNSLGQRATTLYDDTAVPGHYYHVTFDGKNLAAGLYLYRLESGNRSDVKKLLLLR